MNLEQAKKRIFEERPDVEKEYNKFSLSFYIERLITKYVPSLKRLFYRFYEN